MNARAPCTGRRNILTNTRDRRPKPHRAKPADRAPRRAPLGRPVRPAARSRPGHFGKSQPRAPRGRIPCRDRPPSRPPHHPRRPLRRRRTHPHPIRPAGARTTSRHHAAQPSPRVVALPFPLVLRAQSPRTPHRSHPPGARRPAHHHTRVVPPALACTPVLACTPGNALAPGTGARHRARHRPRPRGVALAWVCVPHEPPHASLPRPSPLRWRPDHPLSATLFKNGQWQQSIPALIMLR